jgi:hypothetical protein
VCGSLYYHSSLHDFAFFARPSRTFYAHFYLFILFLFFFLFIYFYFPFLLFSPFFSVMLFAHVPVQLLFSRCAHQTTASCCQRRVVTAPFGPSTFALGAVNQAFIPTSKSALFGCGRPGVWVLLPVFLTRESTRTSATVCADHVAALEPALHGSPCTPHRSLPTRARPSRIGRDGSIASPVQRIMKYPMLITEIKRSLPQDALAAREELAKAMVAASELALGANAGKCLLLFCFCFGPCLRGSELALGQAPISPFMCLFI